MSKKHKDYRLDDLDLADEPEPRYLKKNIVRSKKRKLSKKQWLEIYTQEENLKIDDIEQYGPKYR